jgi:hypothetical protein
LYAVEPSPESVAETAPVIAVPAPVVLAILRQKSRVYGVLVIGEDTASAPAGVPDALHVQVSPLAGVRVDQGEKSTKHSEETYVPVPGVAKLQLEFGVPVAADWLLEGELALGTATSVYEYLVRPP